MPLRTVLKQTGLLGLVLIFAWMQRGELPTGKQNRSGKFRYPNGGEPQPAAVVLPAQSPTAVAPTPLTLGGVVHHNGGGRVDRGTYWLEYRPMPGSTRFRYTPRVVLKTMTRGVDLHRMP